MDPPALMNQGSYNLSEIWPFPITTGGGGLKLRRPHFGDISSADDPMSIDHVAPPPRKRCDDDSSAKGISSSGGNGNGVVSECEVKRLKSDGREAKSESAEPSSGRAEPPKQDYIHVRARRGQATDSHSLAERARREKISERMKILQDLVPGCNKVLGKALVLDEIINYIQSLQRQVEFLSMKLETVNSRIPTGIEVFPSKDINMTPQFGQQTFEAVGMGFGSQAPREYSRGSSPDWLHMQVGGGFDRTT